MPMNNRMVSLPDLMSGKRKNTTLSLSEGFVGAGHAGALLASSQNFAPKRSHLGAAEGSEAARAVGRTAPLYYRTRQLVLTTEKSGRRVPQRMAAELRASEQALIQVLRPLHPLLFQRFGDAQMDRLLRAMPFLRLSHGRWLFGGENDAPDWGKDASGNRAFLLIVGKVALFSDGHGAGDRQDIGPGAVFGEAPFSLGDESVQALVAGAAHCQEPCIVGAITPAAIEAAFADRAFGNRRIANQLKSGSAFRRVAQGVGPEEAVPADTLAHQESKVVTNAIVEMSKAATTLFVPRGQELICVNPAEEGIVMVTQGKVEVRGDITLTEKLDAIPPKKVRLRVYLEQANNLAGDSIFDKLDPYCIVKLGNFKRFQTPIQWNVGPNPYFDYTGVLTFNGEETLEFVIMDHDVVGADDLCGQGSFNVSEITDGLTTKVPLTRPKRGIFKSEGAVVEEDSGHLSVAFKWDFEKVSSLERPHKQQTWHQKALFVLKDGDCWGHEQVALGESFFKKTLEQASAKMKYDISLENFRLFGSEAQGAGATDASACLKVARRRFLDFMKKCGREKQLMQSCRVSTMEKQLEIRDIATKLQQKWEDQEKAQLMRSGVSIDDARPEEVLMEPSHFRVTYRGSKVLISVRNALNLRGSGWFDRADPYAIVRFRGSTQEFRTSVLQDAGADPIWDCEGFLNYSGETTLEISVWDYDKYTSDDLLAIGSLQVEQFCNGFEGMVPLNPPQASTNKKKKKKQITNQSMITLGIQWPPLADVTAQATAHSPLENSLTGAASFLQAGMLSTSGSTPAGLALTH